MIIILMINTLLLAFIAYRVQFPKHPSLTVKEFKRVQVKAGIETLSK